MDALLAQLAASLDDVVLSTAEKHALQADLRARPLRPDQLRQLRNHAFELVLERVREAAGGAAMPALVQWLSDIVKLLDQALHTEPVETEVWFSPGEECRDAVISHLEGCRRHADLCVFTIADDEITAAILAAHRRRVALRVISDDDKRHDSGSDIERLRSAGVAIALDESAAHMHHKFALFDGRWLLNGSFNWTRSASTANEENLVATNDPQQLKVFGEQFEALWARFGGATGPAATRPLS
ncbi:MAG: nuclease [Xanthomonadales bacterium]|nr:hypothetical protein [Xanthomonadales bacterium]MCC6592986.1 nuclease [Xanthomonadales bacterium]MCE7932090.1 nuclease [Xanthomonadales bacterium PRO6]